MSTVRQRTLRDGTTLANPSRWVDRYARRHLTPVLVAGLVAALVLPAIATTRSDAHLVNLWLVYSIAALGFYWMFCLGGRFAFCQAFFMAFGGFVSAAATQGDQGRFVWGVLCAVLTTALLGSLLGWVLRGCNAFYFAVGTFAFAQIGTVVLQHNSSLGGHHGTQIGVAPPELFGRVFLTDDEFFWLLLGALALCLVAAALIERSPARRSAVAAQTNPVVSMLSGVRTVGIPIGFLALGSAAGGLAGAFMTHWQGSISVSSYGLDLSIGIMLMVLLGGVGSIWGPIVGAAVYVFLPARLTVLDEYAGITYGLLLLATIIAAPNGIMGAAGQAWTASRDRLRNVVRRREAVDARR